MTQPLFDADGTESRRRWNQYLDATDAVTGEDETKASGRTESPPPSLPIHPRSVRHVHRLTLEEQDEWSNRMRNRYGGEW